MNEQTPVLQVTDEQIQAVEEASGHSVYGGSSLPRIVKCPASVGMSLHAGLKPESIYAKKGTEMHAWSEKAMRSTNPRKYLLSQDITIDDTALLLDSVEYVQEIIDLHPDGSYTIKLESKGSLASYGLPEVYGTMDVVIESENRIDVIDYKYGFGIAVFAEKNYQLVSYLGMAEPFTKYPNPHKKMFVHICQPPKQIYDCWELDFPVLNQMILIDITDAISNSRSSHPRFGPSESACRFCAANMICTERHAYLRKQANLISNMAKNPSVVSNEQWATFLDGWESLKAAAKHIERHAESEIMAGRKFGDYKLVSGRANRKFSDQEVGEKFIIRKLQQKAYKKAPVISLAQAEKLAPELKTDEEWQDLIYKPQGKPKLVKSSHKGKALEYGVQGLLSGIAAGLPDV